MTSLTVPFIKDLDYASSLETISALLNKEPRQTLAHAPWSQFPYHPEVSFAIAYGQDAIFIQYRVREKHIRAVNSMPNSPVYQDSCVEFFISFDKEPAYYNFEFNCIGANLSGYGAGRDGRKLLTPEIIRQIKSQAQINNDHNSDCISWQLTLAIPFTAFQYHSITSLQGKQAFANFYKCGDELPEPHFVTWSNIQWPEPNFHLRSFFGELSFAD